jgi:DNA-binding MarR family transcriptional regulator
MVDTARRHRTLGSSRANDRRQRSWHTEAIATHQDAVAPRNEDDTVPDTRQQPTLLYVIKQVELAVRARLDEILRPAGISVLQYTALTVLERHPDLSSAQLARNSFVTAQSLADMVGALEDRGLIERHRDPEDRRRLVLALTTDGKKLLNRYRRKVAALEDEMLMALNPRQATDLRRSLSACRAILADDPPR